VARYWRLDPARTAEAGADAAGYDTAVRRAEVFFSANENYNLFGRACRIMLATSYGAV